MSSTVFARRVRATPHRLSSEVWNAIKGLLVSAHNKDANAEFEAFAGMGAYLIEDEVLKDAPLVIHGGGARVRVYCLYGEDAVNGDDANESALPEYPADGDWQLSVPARKSDLDWIRKNLTSKGITRISLRESTETVPDVDESKAEQGCTTALKINEETFRKL